MWVWLVPLQTPVLVQQKSSRESHFTWLPQGQALTSSSPNLYSPQTLSICVQGTTLCSFWVPVIQETSLIRIRCLLPWKAISSSPQHTLDYRKSTRILTKKIYFCTIGYAKAFDYVDHNKLWKILKEMEIPDHLSCLMGNLYAGQEETVRTGYGYWSKMGKGVHQGCTL